MQVPSLNNWELYLVDWGYNTPQERDEAEQHPRVKVINVQQFRQLLMTATAPQEDVPSKAAEKTLHDLYPDMGTKV